jgi:hypothetical protein
MTNAEMQLERHKAEPWLLAALALVLRLALVDRQSLWVDEIFSLAIATGHSLEHPAAIAEPALGDFVESPDPVPAVKLGKYLQHDEPPAGLRRVVRAVRLSDTSPPLYYLLLNAWTRIAGTSDRALKLFSVTASIACTFLLWRIGMAVGGIEVARIATILFVVAPASLYYATEGRMYALLWLVILAHVTLTIEAMRGRWTVAWAASAMIGLMTHYFFAFVWAPAFAWAFIGSKRRLPIALAAAATGVAVAPWYVAAPEIASDWRITGGWLDGQPALGELVTAPARLAWNWVSGAGSWGRSVWGEVAVVVAVGVALLSAARALLSVGVRAPAMLVLAWAVACALGPIAFDLGLGTHASAVRRYALGGAPAAFLIVGMGLSHLAPGVRRALVALLLAGWLPTIGAVFAAESRKGQPYAEIARTIMPELGSDGVVLVHSVPSGVLGVARYLPADAIVASWVPRLERHSTVDVERWLAGASRLIVVESHAIGDSGFPAEAWLRSHARVGREAAIGSCRWTEYLPEATG